MIDLHCHSTFSDGSFTPEQLADKADAIGLAALALTDHDTLSGLARFQAAAASHAFRAVPGIEISVDCPSGVMHMLGYWMDPADAELNRQLEWVRDGRSARNREILRKLNELGFAVSEEEVRAKAGEDVVGRPHFAQVMIEKGYVKDKYDAFDNWLGDGKPAYADRPRLTAEVAIDLLRAAGGVPVLAHPFTLHLGKESMETLLRSLKERGLIGMECYYSEHSADLTRDYLELAARLDLVPTGGSDFHGEASPGVEMGTGMGGLNVPDETVAALEARRPR
ncbi:MAG: PHP domain-containing protein [Kiritimatiellae bacterium]|nr:PHP domain-containing protein [Kiritimatiellia bacterium]